MKTKAPLTQEVFDAHTKRLAVLFTITRTDGVILRFCGHDSPIVYEGNIFNPGGGANGSARRFEDGLRAASFETRGMIDSALITSEDLRAGKYRGAQVTETWIDWRYPFLGAVQTDQWWIAQTSFDKEFWTADLTGPQRVLFLNMGDVLDRTCERTLGNTECGVNLASFTTTGTVLHMEDGGKTRIIRATMGSFSDGYFAFGKITFTSGSNNGLSENVKYFRGSDKRIELQNDMPFEVAPGDTFSIIAGCDQTFTTCKAKFSNGVNFGGFNFIVGTDRAFRGPRLRT